MARIEAAEPPAMATNQPTRPSATAVVCCGVYQSDRGTLSTRMPLKNHAVTASTFMSLSAVSGTPRRRRSTIA